MTYDELMKSILTAQEQMLKHSIEANSVTLNGRKYGKLIENLPPNNKPTIFGMAVKADNDMPDDYDFIIRYEMPQPQTNADRIRSMTDEELAEWLKKQTSLAHNYGYECADGEPDFPDGLPANYDYLTWLRQEADDGEQS